MRFALIPVKELAHAKMRLADVLDRIDRGELALAMLTDVLVACEESGCFDGVVVVSNDKGVLDHAGEMGATPLIELPTVRGLNNSLAFGQRHVVTAGADEVVILPADIPLVRPDDVRPVIDAFAATPGACSVLVRSRDNGTNTLALRPPDAIGMHFGRNSADAHRAAADAADIAVVEIDNERLAYDIDAPEDLEALPGLPVGAATRGWIDAHARYAAGR